MPSEYVEIKFDEASKLSKCLIELKIDGSRHLFNDHLISMRDINRDARYPHLVNELRDLGEIVEGEVALDTISTVLDLNRKENWPKAKFYIFDIQKSGNVFQRRELLEKLVRGWAHLRLPRRFDSLERGWDYVTQNKCEGLIFKSDNVRCKLKRLIEAKVPIIGFVDGKQKGAFLIYYNGKECKVSGTSVGFYNEYRALLNRGACPMAEIEFPYDTRYGTPFQPRLRRVFSQQEG